MTPLSRPATSPAPRIVLFNVKFSPNLGDGLLSECLEAEVRAACPHADVFSLDLAGRRAYGEGGDGRRLKLAVLEALPRRLRAAVAGVALRRLTRRLSPGWNEKLAGADGVILGGGNLLADADLNFPIKIAAALRLVADRGLPLAVHGIGVTPNWSAEGGRLFGAALGDARLIGARVRDDRSRMAWDDLLDSARIPRAGMTIDPGILTARHFPAVERAGGGAPHIALGITDPLALRYHGGAASWAGMKTWLAGLVEALAQRPCRISLFTNGSPEDRRALAAIAPDLIRQGRGTVRIEPDFADPAAMARFVSGADLVMAHRLHACIAAYAYRIPSIGFVWDMKLNSFFELTGRAAHIVDPAVHPPADTATHAWRAIAEGIDPSPHRTLIDRASEDIAGMVRDLLAADTSTRPPDVREARRDSTACA